MKFTDSLVLNMELRSHSSRIDQLDDHLLADIGLSRAELKKQNSWFRRKAR
jgi:uncharacterized protein YjiS (DUF1127 family)